MNEEQLLAIIDNLSKRLEASEKMLVACMEKIEATDKMLTDEIINPIYSAYDKAEDDYNYGEFSKKYGEKLSPYSKIISAEDGEDTDVVRNAYDTYKGYTDEEKADMSEEEYVDKLVTALDEHISKIRESLGLAPDAEVSVTSTEEGKLEVEVNGEPVAEATEEDKAKAEDNVYEEAVKETLNEGETPTTEEVATEEVTNEKTPEEESNDFYKELLRDREKYMKGR